MNSKLDILISRVVDGVARPEDWDALEQMGAADSLVWRELAQAQRAEQVFRAAACEAVAVVDRVELPRVVQAERQLKFRAGRVASWGGWAAAAAVTLAFLGRGQLGVPSGQSAAILPTFSSDQAIEHYLSQGKKEGKVLGEVPQRVLVDTVQMPDGRLKVVFLRQFIEQKTMDQLRQLSTDEAGDQRLVPVPILVAKNPT
jgi:hypothetical protein